VAALREDLAYTSVLTTLRVLESKGCVRHTSTGRAFTYVPLIDRGGAQRTAINDVVSKFFNNSPGALALNLLQDERLSFEELHRLRQLIDEKAPGNAT
ncbi:MAG: BlaI/MecI/CopY family transcriptional regulator, partial [Candidatus Eremiobacteraeota bacterium]|nr:BlaI/MecI/CopY family transcriptional regulator [Candidatus Eremiobacteraeota bacterium]